MQKSNIKGYNIRRFTKGATILIITIFTIFSLPEYSACTTFINCLR